MSGKDPGALTQVLPLSRGEQETGANSEVAPARTGGTQREHQPNLQQGQGWWPARHVMLSARASGESAQLPAQKPASGRELRLSITFPNFTKDLHIPDLI